PGCADDHRDNIRVGEQPREGELDEAVIPFRGERPELVDPLEMPGLSTLVPAERPYDCVVLSSPASAPPDRAERLARLPEFADQATQPTSTSARLSHGDNPLRYAAAQNRGWPAPHRRGAIRRRS